ncbi:hypothetical protein [Aeoliella sp. SH292]|uniref:hypothetical protein n=1 Tax=Aeoliella sp. SH292 TaxID=3454464 RepID=UPI003F9C94FF
MKRLPILLCCCVALAIPSIARADEGWGTLSGRVVLKGEAPKLAKLDTSKDQFCCTADPQNESLKLGKDQGIANVVVFLKPARGEKVAVHPDYAKSLGEPVEFDNKGCAFTPHVALVRVGQPLVLKNTDTIAHSIKAELADDSFNFMLAPDATQKLEFKDEQRLPRPVACSIHPFMRGWLVVRDDPYMAVTDADGNFTIENLPAGEHDFVFWHERPGYLKDSASETAELDRRGRVSVEIKPGEKTDLGTLSVDAAQIASESE